MRLVWLCPANIGPQHYTLFGIAISYFEFFHVLRIEHDENYRPWAEHLGEPPCGTNFVAKDESISKYLTPLRPDMVVVVGYASPKLIKAALWSRLQRVPVVLATDTWWRTGQRYWLKERLKEIIVRILFDGAFVSGQLAAEYIKSLGISEKTIWKGIDVVDNKHFRSFIGPVSSLPGRFPSEFFLTVGRLSPEKNITGLIAAYDQYRQRGGTWGLVIVGTGPSETELQARVSAKIKDAIYWFGWANYEELPSLYQTAKCFILPSTSETWGLVCNEAMAAGLPILVSEMCGCVPELCHEGVNGYTFNPYDRNQLAFLMQHISSNSVNIEEMGASSQRIIQSFTPETWGNALYNCALTLTGRT